MKARHLRIHAASLSYFDAVRRAGSIRAAARRLNVASSAVNRQILSLETEIGMPLFDRLPAGLKLTAAGEILAHHVINVLRDAERTESELDALHGLRAGRVELVTLEGLCHRIVPTAIASLGARAPRISIGVDILATEDIPDAVANGFVQDVDYGDGRKLKMVATPVQFDREPLRARPAPELGAHNDEVLAEIGLSEDEIIDLKVAGVIF